MSTVLAKADALQAKTKKKPLRNGKVMKAKGLKKPSSKKIEGKLSHGNTTALGSISRRNKKRKPGYFCISHQP